MNIRYGRHRWLVRLLQAYWVLLLFTGEIGLFYHHIRQCKWPLQQSTNVAIVADPQIVDNNSYGQTGVLLRVVEFFTDIYMRKSYRFLQTIRHPNHIVFLGDLMDGGREWTDKDWMVEYKRFNSLFYQRSTNTPVYRMAGNHDIGIGNTVVPAAFTRFLKHMGPTNQIINFTSHQVILLDTLTLESDDPKVNQSSRLLVEQLRQQQQPISKPRILFTHVPMWRPPQTDCGPRRQTGHSYLPNRTGYQFRDQLFQNTTQYLLDAIKPVAIFSGDDHDTCTVSHRILGTDKLAIEYTIGAFGWASGVPVASYGLLSLGDDEYMVQHCYLPYQLGIYLAYGSSFAISLLLIGIASYRGSFTYQELPTLQTKQKRSFGYIKYLLTIGLILRSIVVVALPAYIAFLLFFYIS